MLAKNFKGLAFYQNVHESYLRQRLLTGNADWFLLRDFGVGAVISGDFYGWNYGLVTAGIWSIVAVLVIASLSFFSRAGIN